MIILLCTTCPLCHMPPGAAFSFEMAVCMNEECTAIFWDMTVTADENIANMQMLKLITKAEPDGH